VSGIPFFPQQRIRFNVSVFDRQNKFAEIHPNHSEQTTTYKRTGSSYIEQIATLAHETRRVLSHVGAG
jgi:hypothetical protein